MPLVYDDSLSYYEVLCKLTKLVNELIENMRTISEAFDAIQDEFDDIKDEFDYIKTFFEGIQELVDGFNERLTTFEGDFDEFKTYVTNQITEINNRLDGLVVDDALSASSSNPVENRVITNRINQLVNSISALSTRIDNTNTRIDNLPTLNIDDALSSTSENPVQNKVITQALQGVTPATIDSALSDVSENPVQNKVITQSINGMGVSIGNLTNQVEQLWQGLGNVNSNIATVDTKVNSAMGDIANLTTRITNLENMVSQMNSILQGNTSRISALEFLRQGTLHVIGTERNAVQGNTTISANTIIRASQSRLPDDLVVANRLNTNKYLFFVASYVQTGNVTTYNPDCFVVTYGDTLNVHEEGTNYVFTLNRVTYPSGVNFAQANPYFVTTLFYYEK